MEKFCQNCQAPLAPNAPRGLCPACLMKIALASGTVAGQENPGFTPPGIEELAQKFPQLEIIELIGRGGMGAVYKARQKELDRIVALKILPPGIGDDAAFAERFTREAKALAKLNHPGIVTIHDFGRADGLYFFVMEFVNGVNLRQLLSASRISPREALAIVPQICDALQFAHDQGIVHRDIKPENILLDRRGRVKVADFGLAKLVGMNESSTPAPEAGSPSPALTDAGKIMGTPAYMAPEQAQHPAEVDHRADIYALGVVFYQMLTGELPGQKIEAPSTKVRIDVRLDEVVLRALEKKPELRYQQVSDVKTVLETIASGKTALTPFTQSKPVSQTMNTTPKSFWRGLTILVLAVVIAVLAAVIILFLLHAKPERTVAHSSFTSPTGLVELKWKWPQVGERIIYDMDFKQTIAYPYPGLATTTRQDITMGHQYGFTVLKATPDGGHEVQLEILSARMGMKLGGEDTMLDYDSTKKTTVDHTNGVAEVFGKVLGSKINYFFNASNDVERIEGMNELNNRLKSVRQEDPFTSDVKNMFDEAYFKQLVNHNLLLPRQAVQPGDSWPSHLEFPMKNVGIDVVDFIITFKNWEMHEGHNCARLEFQGKLTTKPDPNSKIEATAYHPAYHTHDGVSAGVIWFDPEIGLSIETDVKNDNNLEKKSAIQTNSPPIQMHQVIVTKLE